MAEEEDYVCKLCSKKFSRIDALRRHEGKSTCSGKVIDDLKEELKAAKKEIKQKDEKITIFSVTIKTLREDLKAVKEELQALKDKINSGGSIAINNPEGQSIGNITAENVHNNVNNVRNIINMATSRSAYNALELDYFRRANDECVEYVMNFTYGDVFQIIRRCLVSLYGNPKHPENQTMYVSNIRKPEEVYVCEGQEKGKDVWTIKKPGECIRIVIKYILIAYDTAEMGLNDKQRDNIKYNEKLPIDELKMLISKQQFRTDEELIKYCVSDLYKLRVLHQ